MEPSQNLNWKKKQKVPFLAVTPLKPKTKSKIPDIKVHTVLFDTEYDDETDSNYEDYSSKTATTNSGGTR
jgi:hypothetical protein